MVQKHPICPDRIRKIPKQFSWLDHRLVRDHHIDRCSHQAAALYLFLVTVADARGLSYYSDRTISQRLDMEENSLAQARRQLMRIGLIAYQKPLYQVLALDAHRQPTHKRAAGQLQSLGQIFKQISKEAS
jgi:hypothetical protein